MKKCIFIFLSFITLSGAAQTTTVSYTAISENIANPERGMYHHTETHSTGYSALSQSTLSNYKNNEKITLILRVFYLENFRTSAISQDYLNKIQTDFNTIRNAGLKCIVRFAYSDSDAAGQRDASKAQILSHINQLQPILQNNADVIAVMQTGFIGSWGEWYYTDHFGMSPTTTDYANRREVAEALLSALPANRMIQLRTPQLKQKLFGTTVALSQNQAFSGSSIARVGHHNDCFLASSSDYGTYTNTATEYPYLEQETKFTPMGGETCAPNEPRSGCTTALQEMQKFHWSYLNIDYHQNVISGFITNNCMNDIKNKLGYRFELVNGMYTQAAAAGTTIPFSLKIRNSGWASPYNRRNVYLILRNTVSLQEYAIALNSDPRHWTPQSETTITENINLPAAMAQGSYKMYLSLPDADTTLKTRPEYAIRTANSNTWESTTGYNDLNFTMTIASDALGTTDNTIANAVISPNPSNTAITIELNTISDYNITMYNAMGQQVKINPTVTSNNMVINTEALSEGVYYLQFVKGATKESRRVVVKH